MWVLGRVLLCGVVSGDKRESLVWVLGRVDFDTLSRLMHALAGLFVCMYTTHLYSDHLQLAVCPDVAVLDWF